MTSIEWRKRDDLRQAARALLKDAHFKVMLDIMRSESTIQAPMPRFGTSESDKIMAYGKELGYQFFLLKLLSLAEPITVKQPIESTFESPEQPQTQTL